MSLDAVVGANLNGEPIRLPGVSFKFVEASGLTEDDPAGQLIVDAQPY
jgi:hypothetical protein